MTSDSHQERKVQDVATAGTVPPQATSYLPAAWQECLDPTSGSACSRSHKSSSSAEHFFWLVPSQNQYTFVALAVSASPIATLNPPAAAVSEPSPANAIAAFNTFLTPAQNHRACCNFVGRWIDCRTALLDSSLCIANVTAAIDWKVIKSRISLNSTTRIIRERRDDLCM